MSTDSYVDEFIKGLYDNTPKGYLLKIVNLLWDCSNKNKGCENCKNIKECCRLSDKLKTIKTEDKYNNLVIKFNALGG
jgi:hypothetical protein